MVLTTQRRGRRPRRNRGLQVPAWAPNRVDAELGSVEPLPGWVVIEEQLNYDDTTVVGGMELQIVRPGVENTVYGRVVALNPRDAEQLGVGLGELVVYREWEGGRWSFREQSVLILKSEHILARVDD